MGRKKEYSNGEVTVVWQPKVCMHSGICFRGLPSVFQPKVRPWIIIEAASTEDIVNQVKACPSGALSYYMNAEGDKTSETLETKVEVLKNGPLLVYGTLKVTHKDGKVEIKNKTTAFCRCGASNNKPYCDGTHVKHNFVG
ncbi:MAG TPA: (4Fe-4S)-binding protein [Flavobacteriaceae bacterium]